MSRAKQAAGSTTDVISEANALPGFTVLSSELGGAAAFAAFQQSIGDVFKLKRRGREPVERYRLDMAVWHLGTMMIGRFASSALIFDRSPALIATGGLDHLLVQLYVAGGFVGEADGLPITVEAGDLVCFDLSRPLRTESTDFANVSLLIPRSYFEGAVDDPTALHGLVLPRSSQLAGMLASFVENLAERLPSLRPSEAEGAARATASIATTLLASVAHDSAPAERAAIVSPFRTIALRIDERLHDPALDVAMLASDLGMSRATLYRVFEPVGGVADYIRRRRLTGAAVDLAAPQNKRRKIGEVAFSWGFTSESTFNRAFKTAFGVTPKAARESSVVNWSAHHGLEGAAPTQQFARWIRLLHS